MMQLYGSNSTQENISWDALWISTKILNERRTYDELYLGHLVRNFACIFCVNPSVVNSLFPFPMRFSITLCSQPVLSAYILYLIKPSLVWVPRLAIVEYKSKRMSGRLYRWKSPQIHILRQGRCIRSSGNGGFLKNRSSLAFPDSTQKSKQTPKSFLIFINFD